MKEEIHAYLALSGTYMYFKRYPDSLYVTLLFKVHLKEIPIKARPNECKNKH